MSQEQILWYLKLHSPEKFTAAQLQRWFGLNKSIYPNLQKMALIDKIIKWRVHVSDDKKRKKEFVYWYED